MQAWFENAEHILMSNLAIASGSAGSAPNEPRESEFSLQRIASTMEIIDPRDITLVKFLGSGGYGEVHLGKWHSSGAAIKCLNPSLFFQVTYIHESCVVQHAIMLCAQWVWHVYGIWLTIPDIW